MVVKTELSLQRSPLYSKKLLLQLLNTMENLVLVTQVTTYHPRKEELEQLPSKNNSKIRTAHERKSWNNFLLKTTVRSHCPTLQIPTECKYKMVNTHTISIVLIPLAKE